MSFLETITETRTQTSTAWFTPSDEDVAYLISHANAQITESDDQLTRSIATTWASQDALGAFISDARIQDIITARRLYNQNNGIVLAVTYG